MRVVRTSLVLLLSIFSALFVFLPTVSASRPLSLDGNNQETYGAALSQAIMITTSHKNDLIILAASELANRPLGSSQISSVSDSAGLSWANRFRAGVVLVNGNGVYEELWFAISPSILESDSITLEFTPTSGGTESTANPKNFTNGGDLQVFGVSGVDTANPFDPNPALPVAAIHSCLPIPPGCTSEPSVTMSPSKRNELVYGIMALWPSSTPNATADEGFSLIQSSPSSAIEYSVVKGQISSELTIGFTLSSSSEVNQWLMIGDAVQGSAHGVSR